MDSSHLTQSLVMQFPARPNPPEPGKCIRRLESFVARLTSCRSFSMLDVEGLEGSKEHLGLADWRFSCSSDDDSSSV